MYTLTGVSLVVLVAFLSNREQDKHSTVARGQDARAVMWLLAAVAVMLGIIADIIL